jgi:hypothetical protein
MSLIITQYSPGHPYEYVGGRDLLLQRFAQFVVQPRILVNDCRLPPKCLAPLASELRNLRFLAGSE